MRATVDIEYGNGQLVFAQRVIGSPGDGRRLTTSFLFRSVAFFRVMLGVRILWPARLVEVLHSPTEEGQMEQRVLIQVQNLLGSEPLKDIMSPT
jgi:hypothetical protein